MNPEQKLIEKAKNGNKNAFAKLIILYQDNILYLAFDYLENYDEAKDVAQDVFMKAYQKLDSFQSKSKFATWLYRIAVNTCIDYLRKRERRAHQTEMIGNTDYSNNFTANGVEDSNVLIESAMSSLSKNQHAAIILKYYHDKSTAEIGSILGCDVSTVRIHIFRAMKKLLNK